MARKKSRMHIVHPPKDDSVIGVIRPLELFLRARRTGGRAGQTLQSVKLYNRARAKQARRKEVGS